MKVNGSGSIPSRIMIVGDAPSDSDVRTCTPFSGGAGHELNRLLHEAGIMGSECYLTYVSKRMAPEGLLSRLVATKKNEIGPSHVKLHSLYVLPQVAEGYTELLSEIEMVRPNIIIAMGNLALFALTGQWSVMKWRGSQLRALPFGRMQTEEELPKVIPTYHPSQIFKQFELRAIVLNDLRRVKKHSTSRHYDKPDWKFCVRPSYPQTISILNSLTIDCEAGETWIDFDIETRGRGHVYIDCIGISWSRTEAICIPFMARGNHEGYWNLEEEADIVYRLYKLLTHKNVRVRWQNGLFDAQIVHYNWHFIPRGGQDTMIAQHSVFAALPKALDFIASMYADWYVYWKDEGKVASDLPEEQRWVYNLQDCVYTREAGEVLAATIKHMGLEAVDENQQALFAPVLRAMLTGVRILPGARADMAVAIQEELSKREAFLYNLLGHTINVSSPKQMTTLFYDDLSQPVISKRTFVNGHAKLSPTCDDEALQKIAAKEPILRPLTNCIADIRTLQKFLGDFVMMPTDLDGRMRCSFNIAGDAAGKSAPYSYRLSSSKNPFGNGGNLQTIPSKNSKSSGKAAARGSLDQPLPNIKTMYGPDPGFTFFDMDLDRADLQVVVWEADDEMLKAALHMGADIHLLNTYGIDNKEPPALEELVETHPRYADHRGPRKYKREFAKVFCHACVTAGHEVLTRDGWVPIEQLPNSLEIAVWSKDTKAITFEVPSAFNRDLAKVGETLIAFEGQAFSQEVTSDHRMPYITYDERLLVSKAEQVPRDARIPTNGLYSGTRSADEALIRLLAAFQADGFFDYKYRVGWHLKKQRKIDRLLWLAARAGLVPNVQQGEATRVFLTWRPVDYMKVPGPWLLELDGQALDWWLDELKFWDGHQGSTGSVHISSSNAQAAEWINTIAQLRGKGSRCYVHTPAKGNRKDSWHVSLNNRNYASVASMRVIHTVLKQDTPVYCPQTSTGFFMVRRNGKISVTGNTNYLGKANTVAAHTGRTVHEIDQAQKRWFAAHPGILRWHERVTEQVTKYRFVENKFGYRWYIFDRIDALLLPAAVAWIPQCVPLDHEVLTPLGWMRIDEVSPGLPVAIWAPDGTITFEVPSHWHFGEATELLYMEGLGYYCTPNHRIPYKTGDNSTIRVRTACELKAQARIPRTGLYEGSLQPTPEELAYIVAFQADGHYDVKRDSIQFEFQKTRKIERLTQILDTLRIPYTKSIVRRGATTFYIPKGKHGLSKDLKHFGEWLLQLSGKALDFILEELEFWDGWRSPQGELWYSSSVKSNCDWITTIAALRGKRARWLSPDLRGTKPNYRVTIAPEKGKYSETVAQKTDQGGLVGCPTVSTGFFLLRYKGEISVTGNSTVGIVINKAWRRFYETLPEVQVLLQVHDSLAGQFPTHRKDYLLPKMEEASRIVIPYDDPLIIPTGVKTSTVSWGDCK